MKNIVKRANGKLHMLRLLKRHNLPWKDLITVYTCYVRPVLEYAVPVWNGALTANQKLRMERLQKRALRIIFGRNYTTYNEMLIRCNLSSLEERRTQLCSSFIRKTLNDTPQFRQYLPPINNNRFLRNTNKIPNLKCKTTRMQNSSLPYLVNLYNSNSSKQ